MIKRLVVGALLLVVGFVGWRWYVYRFDMQSPLVTVQGLQEGGFYTGTVPCCLICSDRCKVHSVCAWLDERSIIRNDAVDSSKFEHQFSLVTRALSDGPHSIKVEAIDGALNNNKTIYALNFNVDNAPLRAVFGSPSTECTVSQGRTLRLPIQLNKTVRRVYVRAANREFQAYSSYEHSTMYECFIPIDYDFVPGEYAMSADVEDFLGNTCVLSGKFIVEAFPFARQVLYHIDQSQFEEERRLGKDEQTCADILVNVAKNSPKIKRWRGAFLAPINVTATRCTFGARRISQERGCYVHTGVDVVGCAPHTAVWAPNDGVIVVKDRFAVNGNMIVIDHGAGVITMLGHLDHFTDVAVGDVVKKGRLVGVTGKTGYATGDHLHWEMRINNIPVDPFQWTKTDF